MRTLHSRNSERKYIGQYAEKFIEKDCVWNCKANLILFRSQQYLVLLFIITNKFDTKWLLKIFLVLIAFNLLDSDKYFGNNHSLVKNINGMWPSNEMTILTNQRCLQVNTNGLS